MSKLTEKAKKYLDKLCLEISERSVGSSGNREAAAWASEVLSSFGFQTRCTEFDCMHWTHGEASLAYEGGHFQLNASPYSLGCEVTAPLLVVSTVKELERLVSDGNVLLLYGDIAREQLMPKNFDFYNPPEHQHIIHLLESRQPAAIISATGRNPELAGGMYPFPLIEDGDFDIPSLYTTEEEGLRLAALAGKIVEVHSEAARIPAKGCNVIARSRGKGARKIVFCAHIDSKLGTPGALDNASGVTVLLLLAELIIGYQGDPMVEIVLLNGEDYYSAVGQKLYLAENDDKLDQMALVVNIDAAGYHQGNSAFSLYGLPTALEAGARRVFSAFPDIIEGEAWYQSDHSIFIQQGVPAIAFTSSQYQEISTWITHTERDTTEMVDGEKLVSIALALRDLLLSIHAGLEAVDTC
jgi:aminopeptidase YwaD